MTDDDPVTATLLFLTATEGETGGLLSQTVPGFEGPKAAAKAERKQERRRAAEQTESTRLSAEAANKRTATPVLGLSEQAKRNRRLQASQLTREFAPPTLAQPALTGA